MGSHERALRRGGRGGHLAGVSADTRTRIVTILRGLAELAQRRGYIDTNANPIAGLKQKHRGDIYVPPKLRPTTDQVEAYCDILDAQVGQPWWRSLKVRTGAYGGLRPEEQDACVPTATTRTPTR